jgi:hypothetical protein
VLVFSCLSFDWDAAAAVFKKQASVGNKLACFFYLEGGCQAAHGVWNGHKKRVTP